MPHNPVKYSSPKLYYPYRWTTTGGGDELEATYIFDHFVYTCIFIISVSHIHMVYNFITNISKVLVYLFDWLLWIVIYLR